jgi:hypothetical protein
MAGNDNALRVLDYTQHDEVGYSLNRQTRYGYKLPEITGVYEHRWRTRAGVTAKTEGAVQNTDAVLA